MQHLVRLTTIKFASFTHLRTDSTATRGDVQKLEVLLAENKEIINKLREDRARIANERIDLQRRLLKAEEVCL